MLWSTLGRCNMKMKIKFTKLIVILRGIDIVLYFLVSLYIISKSSIEPIVQILVLLLLGCVQFFAIYVLSERLFLKSNNINDLMLFYESKITKIVSYAFKNYKYVPYHMMKNKLHSNGFVMLSDNIYEKIPLSTIRIILLCKSYKY